MLQNKQPISEVCDTLLTLFSFLIKQASIKWSIHTIRFSTSFRSILTYLLNLCATGKLTTGLEKGFLISNKIRNYHNNLLLSSKTFCYHNHSFNGLTNWSFNAWHNWRCSFIALFFFSLSNEKHYNFLLQEWLMEHNNDQMTYTYYFWDMTK